MRAGGRTLHLLVALYVTERHSDRFQKPEATLVSLVCVLQKIADKSNEEPVHHINRWPSHREPQGLAPYWAFRILAIPCKRHFNSFRTSRNEGQAKSFSRRENNPMLASIIA